MSLYLSSPLSVEYMVRDVCKEHFGPYVRMGVTYGRIFCAINPFKDEIFEKIAKELGNTLWQEFTTRLTISLTALEERVDKSITDFSQELTHQFVSEREGCELDDSDLIELQEFLQEEIQMFFYIKEKELGFSTRDFLANYILYGQEKPIVYKYVLNAKEI